MLLPCNWEECLLRADVDATLPEAIKPRETATCYRSARAGRLEDSVTIEASSTARVIISRQLSASGRMSGIYRTQFFKQTMYTYRGKASHPQDDGSSGCDGMLASTRLAIDARFSNVGIPNQTVDLLETADQDRNGRDSLRFEKMPGAR
jgi:hypothetical protein